MEKIYLVSSTIPFDDAKIHVTLSGIDYSRNAILCKKNLSPNRFTIITTLGAADCGESKEYSISDFKEMPNACKACLKALNKLK